MDKQTMEGEKIPTDFGPEILLDEDKLERFLELFNVKIIYEKNKLLEIDVMKEKIEKNIEQLKLKFKILNDYKKFQDLKGFGVVNQHIQEHMKEINAANSERIPMPDFSKFNLCMNGYYTNFDREMHHCFKNRNHLGPCGSGC